MGVISTIMQMKQRRLSSANLVIVAVFIVSLSVDLGGAEFFHFNRDRSVPRSEIPTDKHIVTTYDQCKAYLCKYGYLKDCDCQESLIRVKRNILEDGMFPNELISESVASSIIQPTPPEVIRHQPTHSSRTLPKCDAVHFRKALKLFQDLYGLDQDQVGVCDSLTKELMSKRRCGQSDTVMDTDDSGTENKPIRARRSLGELITGGAPAVEKQIQRRKIQLQKYLKDIEKETADARSQLESSHRDKRAMLDITINDDTYPGLLTKKTVTWRFMSGHYFTGGISPASQRSILKQAFRYWSEVSPICFREVNDSLESDIKIGFMTEYHLGCNMAFDGFGGEVAHKSYRDVHFDISEPYTDTVVLPSQISLKLVAVHELGHVMGLNHSNVEDSVMHAVYHENMHGNFELGDHDRLTVKREYGSCSGTFNIVFDFVRSIELSSGGSIRIFNSYFFRMDHYWMYENTNSRARYGDPLEIQDEWAGLPTHIDAFIHKVEVTGVDPATGRSIVDDEHIFISGNQYYVFDAASNSVSDSGLVSTKFPAGRMALPTRIDTAYWDPRDTLTYFFSGQDVYVYHYKSDISHSCCVSKHKIVDLFPPSSSADLQPLNGVTYASDIDAVYLSYTSLTLYFIKGEHVWKNTQFSLQPSSGNSMLYVGKWNTLWDYICDGECS